MCEDVPTDGGRANNGELEDAGDGMDDSNIEEECRARRIRF